MIKRIVAFLAFLAVGIGLIASPAQAYTGSHDGVYGYVVAYDGIGWTGTVYPLPIINEDVCRNLPSYMNDLPSAIDNERGVVHVRFYSGGNCGGTGYVFYANTDDGQLSAAQGNNSYSSFMYFR